MTGCTPRCLGVGGQVGRSGGRGERALPALLLHHLAVVFVQSVLTDETLEARCVLLAGGIAIRLQAARPADVVVRREIEEVRVAFVAPQKERMVLVAVGHGGVLTELLVRLVVRVHEVTAAAVQPRLRRLDPEMVIPFPGQFALPACALQYALGERDGSRDAVLSHLLHRRLGVPVHIVTCLAHRSLYRYPVLFRSRVVVSGLEGTGGQNHGRQSREEDPSDGKHGFVPPLADPGRCRPQ